MRNSGDHNFFAFLRLMSTGELWTACESGDAETLGFAIDDGVDLENEDIQGRRVLHVCCDKEYVELVKILIKNGAECSPEDNDGITPLHLAAKREI